ncbi:FAD-dependent oxidoreductase [Aquincola sp. S2]|uniref:FAD-dependent oxidoreductase n=1 Tax=Pseudaquabacterium terrae TaxID=2732868 RepID=A0ABX2EPN6_9BURK|nr:FAD-dependent oxidoreductase [Aquabacterium terrae]NRF70610.1 FAD-dependent oxidoreductase [Aquabacterium terrae]
MADDQQAREIKVAVVGGGIAGLTAAWALLNRGYKVTLYEERMHLGGKMGAHPARIPLWRPRKQWQPGAKEAAEAYIDVDQGAFHSEAAADKLSAAMDRGEVPAFILEALRFHYLGVMKRLGLEIPALDVWADEWELLRAVETLPPGHRRVTRLFDDSPHLVGARDKWEICYTGVKVRGLEALTLAFRVAIYDRRDGRLALELSDTAYHEHCYHMFLNWYRNFWALMEEVGLERSTAFRPHDEVVHVLPGTMPLARRSQVMTTLGDFSRGAENLLSGAASVPDLFLWMYSMVDLVSHQFDPGRYLDRRSVHAFLSSRWYATEQSVRFHEHLLAKAFAVPTYFSSAYTYRKYVAYTMAAPDPMLWVLHGDSYTALFEPFEERLKDKGLKIRRGLQVRGISRGAGPLRMEVRASDILGAPRSRGGRRVADDGEAPADAAGDTSLSSFTPDYIVLAVPPSALARITFDFRTAVPGLASVRKLQSAVTASLDLHFVRPLDGIPPSHMVLRQSALGLTLMDNAQAWHDDDPDPCRRRPTQLSVAVTDFYKIDGMSKAEATTAIIEDLRRFFDFRDEDIDFTRTYLQMNDGEPLFINEVGSEPWRPGTRTELRGLFLAGDFCENDIGVVTVEGAVVSGLLAARAVQAQLREDRPEICATDPLFEEIPILQPETLPLASAEAVKALLLPQAAMAYAASKKMEWARCPERALTPRDLQFHLEQALQSAGAAPAIGAGLAAQAAQWVADQHARGRA